MKKVNLFFLQVSFFFFGKSKIKLIKNKKIKTAVIPKFLPKIIPVFVIKKTKTELKITPKLIAKNASLKGIPNKKLRIVPLQAPVRGKGIPTNKVSPKRFLKLLELYFSFNFKKKEFEDNFKKFKNKKIKGIIEIFPNIDQKIASKSFNFKKTNAKGKAPLVSEIGNIAIKKVKIFSSIFWILSNQVKKTSNKKAIKFNILLDGILKNFSFR
jgi:hypothetical protein